MQDGSPCTTAQADDLHRIASRDELLPLAGEPPDAEDINPAVLRHVCATLDGLTCPVFSPFDYSTGAGQLLQVSGLCVAGTPNLAHDIASSVMNTFFCGIHNVHAQWICECRVS